MSGWSATATLPRRKTGVSWRPTDTADRRVTGPGWFTTHAERVAVLTATGTFTTTIQVKYPDKGHAFDGSGRLTATVKPRRPVTAAFGGEGTSYVNAVLVKYIAAAFGGSGDIDHALNDGLMAVITGGVKAIGDGLSALVEYGLGSLPDGLSATIKAAALGAAPFSADGNLQATVSAASGGTQAVTANFSGGGNLTATGIGYQMAEGMLTATVTKAATSFPVTAGFAGSGLLTGALVKRLPVAAALSGSGALSATVTPQMSVAVEFGAPNLAAGSDFEGTHPWALGTGWSIATDQSHSATHSAKSLGSGGCTPQGSPFAVTPGEQFYAELWARRDSAYDTAGSARLRFINQANGATIDGVYFGLSDLPTPNVWTKQTVTFTIPAGVTSMAVNLDGAGTAGTVWIDDIIIRKSISTLTATVTAATPPSTADITDNFNRANSSVSLGSDWTNRILTVGISGNAAYAVSGGSGWAIATHNTPLGSDDAEVSAIVPGTTNNRMLGLGFSAAGDGMFVYSDGSGYSLYHQTAWDSWAWVAGSAAYTQNSGDKITIRRVGNVYSVLQNNVVRLTWTDSGGVLTRDTSHRLAQIGLIDTATWDSFEATHLGAVVSHLTGVTYSQSSNYGSGYTDPATYAGMNDGDAGMTDKQTAAGLGEDPSWIMADAGSVKNIDHIVYGYDYNTTAFGIGYGEVAPIHVSTDGSTWTFISNTPGYIASGSTDGKVSIPIGQSCRYVRVSSAASSGGYLCLTEFELWGN